MNALNEGDGVRLVPRDGQPRVGLKVDLFNAPHLALVGRVEVVAGPIFYVLPDGSDRAWVFRADENWELAVNVVEGSTWEILRGAN